MARVKKEAALTPEERLQAALVPDWGWPYKLPENWCWTYLTKVAECLDNFRKPINATERAGRIGNIPYYGATGQVGWIDDFLTDENLVLLGEDGAPFLDLIKDKAYLISGKAWVNNHAHILRSPFGDTGNRYLLHYLNSFNYVGYVNGTTRLKLTQASMDTIPIPLPPLSEQQRIVDRIESLFAKLDEAKEKAQTVVDSFETRKAAILHKAFTGELTAKWREEHGLRMESWKKRHINEVARPRAGYAFDSKKFTNTGYQVIRMGNLYGETLDLFRKPVFISEDDVDDSILNRALIKDGDILITLTGTKYKRDYGYAVCVSSPNKLLVNQRILCLTPFACVERNYLLYYLKSNLFRDVFFSCETGGVNQGNVSSKFVENIEIPIPTFDEQLEITTVLDRTLAHEQQAKEAAEAVLAQIDLMKKSILARAFRGELGTNDPSEESAVELLKEIIRRG